MSYGLRVYNDSGYLQIDQDFANYQIIQSGTFTIGSSSAISPTISHSGPNDGSNLVFVKPPFSASNVIIDGSSVVGGSSFAVYGDPGTYSYFVAARATALSASSETYGLRVYNSGGGLVFDSGRKTLNIKSISYPAATINATNTEGPIYTTYLSAPASGKSHYVLLNPLTFVEDIQIESEYWETYKMGAAMISNTEVRVHSKVFFWEGRTPFGYGSLIAPYRPTFMIAEF